MSGKRELVIWFLVHFKFIFWHFGVLLSKLIVNSLIEQKWAYSSLDRVQVQLPNHIQLASHVSLNNTLRVAKAHLG